MDYNSLTQELFSYVKRTDNAVAAQMPNIITAGMNSIYLDCKNIGFEIVVNNALTQNIAIFDKPAGWRETISFRITDNRTPPATSTWLIPRGKEFCESYWPSITLMGKPKFYSDKGLEYFYIVPTPDYGYPTQLTYLGLPLFDPQNPVNFLTAMYENLLRYSCLKHLMIFLKDDERLAAFSKLYEEEVKRINDSNIKHITDRTTRREKD